MVHIFIMNKKSLKDKFQQAHYDITKICYDNSLMCDICATSSLEELKEKTTRPSIEKDTVFYAVGGDGTFQALVNNVELDKHIVQYLPYGTGNNAYRTFYGDQKFDLRNDILSKNIISADLGKVNGEYFVTMAGLGLDSLIGQNVEKFRKFKLPGKAKYYLSIFSTILTQYKGWNADITVDGEKKNRDFAFFSITNGPTIGGKTPISPASNPFDGKLNAVVLDKVKLLKLIELFMKINSGGHLNDVNVFVREFENMIIESDEELLYELDGEIRKTKKLEIDVCKNAMRLKGKHM